MTGTMVWAMAGGTRRELRSACPATVKTRFQEILPFPHKSYRSPNEYDSTSVKNRLPFRFPRYTSGEANEVDYTWNPLE